MKDLTAAQEELTKGLSNVKANEVPKILDAINELRFNFDLKSHADLTVCFAAFLHDASEADLDYEHSEAALFLSHQRYFMTLMQ